MQSLLIFFQNSSSKSYLLFIVLSIIYSASSESNGKKPLRIKYMIHPKAKLSTLNPYYSPLYISGAIYRGVPMPTVIVILLDSWSIKRAKPKSAIFAFPP